MSAAAQRQYEAGMALLNGIDVEQDEKAGFAQLKLAAKRNHAAALSMCGSCLEHGRGVEANAKDARKHYRLAADLGDASAMASLGRLSTDKSAGFRLIQRAAELGDRTAFVMLADVFRYGRGVKPNAATAANWLRRASDAGDVGATCTLANILLDGIGVDENVDEAVRLYRVAAEAGDADAMLMLALCLRNRIGAAAHADEEAAWTLRATEAGKDVEAAGADVKWAMRARDFGNAAAIARVANALRNGTDGLAKDEDAAAKWLRRAADHGSSEAALMLLDMRQADRERRAAKKEHAAEERAAASEAGASEAGASEAGASEAAAREAAETNGAALYHRALHTGDDRARFELFSRAAAAGHARSMNDLGMCFLRGIGCAESDKKAVQWMQKSANAGDTDGMYNLGLMYQKGRGVQRNLEKARFWFERAGDEEGQMRANDIREHGDAAGKFSLMGMLSGLLGGEQ
jgi:TPR repeat protein